MSLTIINYKKNAAKQNSFSSQSPKSMYLFLYQLLRCSQCVAQICDYSFYQKGNDKFHCSILHILAKKQHFCRLNCLEKCAVELIFYLVSISLLSRNEALLSFSNLIKKFHLKLQPIAISASFSQWNRKTQRHAAIRITTEET